MKNMDSSSSSNSTALLLIISILFVSSAVADPVLECGSCTPAAPSKPKKKPATPSPGILPPIVKPPTVLPVPPVTLPPVTLPPIKPPVTLPPLPVPPVGKLPPLPVPPVGKLPPLPLPPVGKLPPLPLPPVGKLPPVNLPPVTLPPIGKGGKECPPPPGGKATCPVDTLKLGACVDLLGGLVHIGVGDPVVANKCCPLISGLAEVEAAACLCTTLKIKALNLKLYVPIALQLLITCGKTPPPGYTCSL